MVSFRGLTLHAKRGQLLVTLSKPAARFVPTFNLLHLGPLCRACEAPCNFAGVGKTLGNPSEGCTGLLRTRITARPAWGGEYFPIPCFLARQGQPPSTPWILIKASAFTRADEQQRWKSPSPSLSSATSLSTPRALHH